MKFRSMMVFVVVATLLSMAVVAKNNGEKGKKSDQNKTDIEATTTIDKGLGLQKRNQTEDRNRTQERNESVRNETQGTLISEIQQVRREQFMLMKDELKSRGYHGEVSDFSVAFNRQLKQLKQEIRERLNSSEDSNLTRTVVREVAVRELARIREEKLAGLNISENDTMGALGNISGTNENFTKEIRNMNHRFRAKLLEVAKNGTVEEKKALREQIRNYVSEKKMKIKLLKMEIKQIRRFLMGNKSADEIIGNVST